ncbi:topoisomerase [Lysinibacillus parviboronicapiens]|uniref:topoisomerase n=1 Tax=Lysinibacillus parviboronicapiens TaxID=436516 RepID=UPI001911A822|nr:topoisomerase [Lysinibacillus parviboronicapiens]
MKVLKKNISSGIVFSSILLVGCTGEQKKEQEVQEIEIKQEERDPSKNQEYDDEVSKFLYELKNKIIVSITEQTVLERDTIEIMLEGFKDEGKIKVWCLIGLPKNTKIEDTMVQQIVEDSIKNISETENVTISEENIYIEKYLTNEEVLKGYKQLYYYIRFINKKYTYG